MLWHRIPVGMGRIGRCGAWWQRGENSNTGFRPTRKKRRRNRGGYCRSCGGHGLLWWFLLFLLLGGCVLGFYKMESRIGSLAQQAAISKLNGEITKDTNRAVQTVLEEEQINTRKLVIAEKDEKGKIQSMSTDYNAVNRMKSALAVKIQEHLDQLDVIETRVPAGMLFSDTMMTGAGFDVPVKVFATNAIEVRFYDEFSSAGINQTRYKLMVEVKVPAPGGRRVPARGYRGGDPGSGGRNRYCGGCAAGLSQCGSKAIGPMPVKARNGECNSPFRA